MLFRGENSEELLSCVNTYSSPSNLKITDIRIANIICTPMPCPILRIETNQGITGYGEVRDHASQLYALMLKRLLIGENPCNIDKIFRRIKQFGGPSRQAGGVCGVEIALWDITGKAYGVPVYQMLGGKFRDRIRVYCDTHVGHGEENTGLNMGKALRQRMEMGYTFLKMNLNIDLIKDEPETLSYPAGVLEESAFTETRMKTALADGDREGFRYWRNRNYDVNNIAHPFAGIHITEKGLNRLEQYVAEVRSVIGYAIPLAIDHLGHVGVEDAIKVAQRLEKYNLAWLEDPVPWQFTEQYRRIAQATVTPIATGEDIYLKENFRSLLEAGGVSIIHTDLLSSGGILENKKIGDMAQDYGVALAVHMAGSPVACMAAVHSVAATENFLALEFHCSDVPWWDDIAPNLPKPLIRKGFITVLDTPGLGITDLDDAVLRAHADPEYPEIWRPTAEWNDWHSKDRLWS